MTNLEESLQKHQQEIQNLLVQSGYQRSLVRMHTQLADDLDKRIDVLSKKIRTLELNKPKQEEPKEEEVKTDEHHNTEEVI